MTNLENNDEMMMGAAGVVTLSEDGEEYVSTQVEEVQGRGGDDTIIGALNAQEPGSTLFGNTGNDYIRSRGIGDRVFGGRGDDTIINDNGQAIIYGDLGSDYLVAKDSRTTLFGGRSFGEASAEDGKNILLSLGGKNILKGGGGNDSLVGEAGDDTMAGGDGDDTIRGGPNGASYLFGNKGKDLIFSKAKNNPDTMFGGRGDDVIEVTAESTANAPFLFGGVGDDSLMVMGSVNDAVLVGDVGPDGRFGGSEGEEGGDNYLFVEAGKGHQLFGNAGNDTLKLGVNVSASVSMFGGRGDDYIFGGTGASYSELRIFGGKDNDTIIFDGSISQSQIWGDHTKDAISDGFGNNFIQAGGEGNTLRGGNENATPENAGQNKIILTSGSNNLVVGGPGGDFLSGSAAGETNTLQGGVGNDTFWFGKNQTITSEGGANVYKGFGADKGQEVEVTTQDDIAGEANFVVRGDSSGFHEISKGGIRTPDTDKRQNISITVDASGTTRTGGGNDIFDLGSVSGLVTSSAGDNRFTVANDITETGAVIGGSGSDTISIEGAVLEGGSVSGGDGNDSIFANVVESGAVIDGGEGADKITVNQLFGKVIGGGEGKNIFEIQTAFGGAEIFTGAGDERVLLGAVGSADGDESIFIKGGAGNNRLGISYQTDSQTNFDAGSAMARVDIQGVGGDNIIQGTPFGKDILKGGANTDLLYGGESNFDGDGLTADELAQTGLQIGDGDQLISGDGRTTFLFRTWQETANIQSNFGDITIGSAPEQEEMNAYVLSLGTSDDGGGGVVTTFDDVGLGFSTDDLAGNLLSGGFHVDTLTNFRYETGKEAGDRIFLDEDEFTLSETNAGTAVFEFASAYGGFLFGAIVRGDLADGANLTPEEITDTNDVSPYFKSDFVEGEDNHTLDDAALFEPGRVLFDRTTKGVYVTKDSGGVNAAYLVAVLGDPTNIPANFNAEPTAANNFIVSGPIGDATAAAGPVQLF